MLQSTSVAWTAGLKTEAHACSACLTSQVLLRLSEGSILLVDPVCLLHSSLSSSDGRLVAPRWHLLQSNDARFARAPRLSRAFSSLHVGKCYGVFCPRRVQAGVCMRSCSRLTVFFPKSTLQRSVSARSLCARRMIECTLDKNLSPTSLSPVHGVAMSSYFILGPIGHPLHLLAVTLLAHPSGEQLSMLLDRMVRAMGSCE